MKKIYFAPEMEIVEVDAQQTLLAGSFNDELDQTGGDGGDALAPEHEWYEWRF
jgi:hypothetical protein